MSAPLIGWPVLGAAGVVAGLAGTITGVGSVFSYPVLLVLGLAPTSANVTNTVALALGGVGGALGSRPELSGQARRTARWCLAGAAGTVVGAVLLLVSPPGLFAATVPVLIAVASAAILVPRPPGRPDAARRATPAVAVVAVYNGYFAAGSSVLIVVALLATTSLTLTVVNGLKNVVVLVSDVTAALVFVASGQVAWAYVAPLTAGLLVGSRLGPPVARRLPTGALRIVIALAGLGLATWLGVQATRAR